MKVIVAKDETEQARFAARFIARRMRERAKPVLGLATGASVQGTYRELVRMHREEGLDFSRTTTFNLDEYVGLDLDHPGSYHHVMRRALFDHVNLDPERCYLPNGRAPDLLLEAERYENAIRWSGGIAVQLLGIGVNGHIAFNEPGSSLRSRTRVKRLSEETRRANARDFASLDEVPRYVLTMGVATILDAEFVLLVANGRHKAQAIRDMVEGPLTHRCPASALQLHPHAFVVLDQDAASLLADRYESVDEVLRDPFEEFVYEYE